MKNIKVFAYISVTSNVLFLLINVLFHFLRQDKDPMKDFVSEYAVGKYGWLMTIGFLSFAVASLTVLIALASSLKANALSLISFIIFCTGCFVFALFPTDLPGTTPTKSGLVHGFSALFALVSLALTMIVWGNIFKRATLWCTLAKPSKHFGILSFVLFVLFILSPLWLKGFTERVLLVLDVSWLIIVSIHLLKIQTISNSLRG